MSQVQIDQSIKVVGIAIETNNQEAANTIVAQWGKYFSEQQADMISDKVSDDIFAVYTNFENKGVNNEGQYTFVIGAQVEESATVPEGMTEIIIPADRYQVFDVETGKPEKVFEKWGEIWSNSSFEKTFVCDFERYTPQGEISISVGCK